MKRISSFLLVIILIFVMLSVTSCGGAGETVNGILSTVPEEEHALANFAHELGDLFHGFWDNFLSFEWLRVAIDWCDDTFHISESIELIKGAIELFKEGGWENTVEAIGILFGRVSLLFVSFVIALVVVSVIFVIEVVADALLGALLGIIFVLIAGIACLYLLYGLIF